MNVTAEEPLRIRTGGILFLESGAVIKLATGATIVPEAGGLPAAITDATTGGSATAANCATAINGILAALRNAGLIASA